MKILLTENGNNKRTKRFKIYLSEQKPKANNVKSY